MFLFLRLLISIIFAIGNTFIKIVLVQKRIKKIILFTCNFKFLGNYFSISVFDFIVIFFFFSFEKIFLVFPISSMYSCYSILPLPTCGVKWMQFHFYSIDHACSTVWHKRKIRLIATTNKNENYTEYFLHPKHMRESS